MPPTEPDPGNPTAHLWPTLDMRSARLHGLIARGARRAVVLRRAPAQPTLLITWDLARDGLMPGQWLAGRVYERRCDLSPDGELLVYAATRGGSDPSGWTALSRPPYFAALAVWKDAGMWGGGLFGDDWRALQLNQIIVGPAGKDPAAGPIAPQLRVSRLQPMLDELALSLQRLARDGWRVEPAERVTDRHSPHYGVVFDPPIVQTRELPGERSLVVLTHAAQEQNGRAYVETASVRGPDGAMLVDLGRVDWADADHTGDVLTARDGRLYRLSLDTLEREGPEAAQALVADLNDLPYQPVAAPAHALRWP